MTERQKPSIIEQVGFDFSWDERKVWELDVPKERMDIRELEWHLAVPFLWSPGGYYDIMPQQVLDDPEQYTDEYVRTLAADTTFPIDIMWWRGRWVILDGLHRLMKQYKDGVDVVEVRKVPEEFIAIIKK